MEVELDGVIHQFPEDATDEEIRSVLEMKTGGGSPSTDVDGMPSAPDLGETPKPATTKPVADEGDIFGDVKEAWNTVGPVSWKQPVDPSIPVDDRNIMTKVTDAVGDKMRGVREAMWGDAPTMADEALTPEQKQIEMLNSKVAQLRADLGLPEEAPVEAPTPRSIISEPSTTYGSSYGAMRNIEAPEDLEASQASIKTREAEPYMEEALQVMQKNPEKFIGQTVEDVAYGISTSERAGDAAELATDIALMGVIGPATGAAKGASIAKRAWDSRVLGNALRAGTSSGISRTTGNIVGERDLDEGLATTVGAGAVLGGTLGKVGKMLDPASNTGLKELQEIGEKAKEIIDAEKAATGGFVASKAKKTKLTDDIIVEDILDAQSRIKTLKELNKRGGRVGTREMSEQIGKDALADVISSARPMTEKVSNYVEDHADLLGNIVGLTNPATEKARRQAVNKLSRTVRTDIKSLVDDIKGMELSSGMRTMSQKEKEDFITPLQKKMEDALSLVSRGKYEEAEQAGKFVQEALKASSKKGGGITNVTDNLNDPRFRVESMNDSIQSLRQVAERATASSTGESLIKQYAIPFIIGAADASTGLAVAATREGVSRGVESIKRGGLTKVEKALKGELKNKSITELLTDLYKPAGKALSQDEVLANFGDLTVDQIFDKYLQRQIRVESAAEKRERKRSNN